MSSIAELASGVFIDEFDSSGVVYDSISGWFENNLGQLNNALYTNFSGSNGQISGLNLEEQEIYKQMYLYHYYTLIARFHYHQYYNQVYFYCEDRLLLHTPHHLNLYYLRLL